MDVKVRHLLLFVYANNYTGLIYNINLIKSNAYLLALGII